MFEDRTYENILNEMLASVSSKVDKREGSIIYDALSPAALKMAEMYYQLNNYTDLIYLDTTSGSYLDKKASDFGIKRKEISPAIVKIKTDDLIELGTRWTIESVVYEVISMESKYEYRAKCEQAGETGNIKNGELKSIENLNVKANITDIFIYGEEEEADENLRERLKNKIANTAQDGNVRQYLQWAEAYKGIGKAKVFPLWNGGNTVKISITTSAGTPANPKLIEEFQNYLDPKSEGLGEGKAPLGAKVTVTTGSEKKINISADIVLEEGYSDFSHAREKIEEYLKKITYGQNHVSYFYIGNILVGLDSIYDMKNLVINNMKEDIQIGEEEIPILGELNLTVVR